MAETKRRSETTEIIRHVVCPCCGEKRNTRRDTPLLALEQSVREHGADPWHRSPGWSVAAAQTGRLQWACTYCIEQGRAHAAHPWVQKFCDFLPYFAYLDRASICTDCHVSFVFSAREQEYWYERLKFWVQSYPKQCPACRRKRRQSKQVQTQLKTALDHLDDSDMDQLLQIADLYVRLGSLTKALTFFRRPRERAHSEEQKRLIEQSIETL